VIQYHVYLLLRNIKTGLHGNQIYTMYIRKSISGVFKIYAI